MSPCGESNKALKYAKHIFNSIQDNNFPIPQCQVAQPKPDLEQEEGRLLWPLSRPSSSCKDTPGGEGKKYRKLCMSQNTM